MKRGFTLVELAVVIIIIALLVAIALPQFMRMQEQAKATQAKLKLDAIKKAELAFYAQNDTFTTNGDDLSAWVDTNIFDAANDNDTFWDYTLVRSGALTTQVIARATRTGGANNGDTIDFTINRDGTVTVGGTHPGAK